MEETSEQTRGREIEPTTWGKGKGRKDKSRDFIANMGQTPGKGWT